MKKFYLFLILISLSAPSRSQSYAPLLDSISNTWHFAWNVIPVRVTAQAPLCTYPLYPNLPAWTYTTVYDTVINTNSYKAIGRQDYGIPVLDCIAGFLREDTAARKVYFMDNQFGPEELLYDFSMQPGNTIQLAFTVQGFFQDGTYILDSIRPVNLISGVHRLFFLHNQTTAQPWPQLQWIEGVGHPGNLLYTKSDNFMGGFFAGWCQDNIDRNFSDLLTCFYQGNQKIYFDSCAHAGALQQQGSPYFQYVDSCTYWNLGGSVEEINGLASLKATPNPATDRTEVRLEATKNMDGTLCVRDLFGRKVMPSIPFTLVPGSNSMALNTARLDAGIYLIEFRTTTGSKATRVVIAP